MFSQTLVLLLFIIGQEEGSPMSTELGFSLHRSPLSAGHITAPDFSCNILASYWFPLAGPSSLIPGLFPECLCLIRNGEKKMSGDRQSVIGSECWVHINIRRGSTPRSQIRDVCLKRSITLILLHCGCLDISDQHPGPNAAQSNFHKSEEADYGFVSDISEHMSLYVPHLVLCSLLLFGWI